MARDLIFHWTTEKIKEINRIDLQGGDVWYYDPRKVLDESDWDDKFLIKSLLDDEIMSLKTRWMVRAGALTLDPPFENEAGEHVVLFEPTALFFQMRDCVRSGVIWNIIERQPDFKQTQEFIEDILKRRRMSDQFVKLFAKCHYPELDAAKKEVTLFKLHADFDEKSKHWIRRVET